MNKADMIDVLSKKVGEQFRQDITNALGSESSRPVDDLMKDFVKNFQKARILKKMLLKSIEESESGSATQIFAIRVLAGVEEKEAAAKQTTISPSFAGAGV